MSIKLKDSKLLWSKSGSICAKCRQKVYTEGNGLIGDQAHIVGEKVDGPRGISILDENQRNSYGNLILLCKNCHKEVDDNVALFPVELLHLMKSDHERWVESKLSTDKWSDAKSVALLTIIGDIDAGFNLDDWDSLSSQLFSSGHSTMTFATRQSLESTLQRIMRFPYKETHAELAHCIDTIFYRTKLFLSLFGSGSV